MVIRLSGLGGDVRNVIIIWELKHYILVPIKLYISHMWVYMPNPISVAIHQALCSNLFWLYLLCTDVFAVLANWVYIELRRLASVGWSVIDWGKLITLSTASFRSLTEANWSLCLQHLSGRSLRQTGHSVYSIFPVIDWGRSVMLSVCSIFPVIDWGKLVSLSGASSWSLTKANWSLCLHHLHNHWLRQIGHSVHNIFPVIDWGKLVILSVYSIFSVID